VPPELFRAAFPALFPVLFPALIPMDRTTATPVRSVPPGTSRRTGPPAASPIATASPNQEECCDQGADC
jgi:hypothetical protein